MRDDGTPFHPLRQSPKGKMLDGHEVVHMLRVQEMNAPHAANQPRAEGKPHR